MTRCINTATYFSVKNEIGLRFIYLTFKKVLKN